MNSGFLDTLEKDQVISPRFAGILRQDFLVLEKTGAASAAGKAGEFLKNVLPHVAVILGTSALAGGFGYLTAKRKFEDHQGELASSRNLSFGKDQSFARHPEAFHQRFSELSLISPTVASNPNMASKLISTRLHDGFNLDDIHRLSAIEYHTSQTGTAQSPQYAARTKALSQLESSIGSYAPTVITNILDRAGLRSSTNPMGVPANYVPEHEPTEYVLPPEKAAAIEERMKEMMRKKKMEKKASVEGIDIVVSEECLGRMLADRHCMYKQANVVTKAIDTLKPSAGHLGEYLKFMAIPLAIGGGVQLVQKLMRQKENEKMRMESERVYAGLMRSNEKIKSHKEIADEAFDALRSFAPALATKPIVARTFIENTIDGSISDKYGRLAPETTKMLTETQDLVNRLNNASSGGFLAGLKENMSIFGHSVKAPHKKES